MVLSGQKHAWHLEGSGFNREVKNMDLTELVKPELLILVPVLYLIGATIKKYGKIDKYIPLILGGAGVLLAGIYLLAVEPLGFNLVFGALTQGILCAGLSVYANQVYKQFKKNDDEK